MILRQLFKESSFGHDIYNFTIDEEQEGQKVILKATSKDETPEVAGYIVVNKGMILKLNVSEETKDPTHELLKYLCRMYDKMNQPLTADKLGISLNFQRTLEAFGFQVGDDDIMMRLAYSVIPYSLKT